MLDARSNTATLNFMGPKKVKRAKFTSRPFFVLSLALIFFINSIGGGSFLSESWAANTSSELPSVGSEVAGGPAPLKTLNADTFMLPRELGYVQESANIPDSARTVIHVQDAHCNYAAQKSISEILNYLTAEYGIYAVNCEGGKDGYDLSVFTDIPEKDIREKTSDFFVKEGVVNAAEYFAVNNPSKVKLWGVEDADLYIRNLKIYRDSLSFKGEVDRDIKSISYILDNLKRHIYSNELLEFDTHYSNYKDNKIGFKEYMAYLITAAGKRLIDIKSFSDIYLLSQTLEQEDKIDFRKANNEKDEIVDRLKKVLSKNELEELMRKVDELKTERISQADFYAYLAKKAKSIKLDLSGYPELQKYIIYVSLYSAIDRTKISQEMTALEDRIRDSLYENDTQRELGILSKNLILTKNIFSISLTRDDYTYYVEHRATFAVANYVNFIDRYAPLYKITARLDEGVARLDVYREKMDEFYQCSLERDKAFVRNIKFTDHDRPNSIIITGGFHTENLRELFKKENVSYISIMPKFKNEKGYESPYLRRLAGQRTALENVIDTAIPAVLNLAVVNILSKLGIIVEGKANIDHLRLAVAIVAAVTRGPQFVVSISKDAQVGDKKLEQEKFITFTQADVAENRVPSMTPTAQGPVNASIAKDGSVEIYKQPETLIPGARMAQEASSVQAPAEEPTTKAEAVETTGKAENEYKSAVKPAAVTMSMVRRDIVTRIIAPVADEGEVAPTANDNRMAENLLGKEIHLKSYLAKGDWMKELKKILEGELRDFRDDIVAEKLAPRMLIRVKAEKEKDTRQDIINFINEFLAREYSAEIAAKIFNKIRVIQVQIESGQRFNPAIEFFSDMGMLEIDRHISGDYGEDNKVPPPDLRNNFLALLKLSITNIEAFDEKQGVEAILKKIFDGEMLVIRPVKLDSLDEWKRANRQLLQSV